MHSFFISLGVKVPDPKFGSLTAMKVSIIFHDSNMFGEAINIVSVNNKLY